MNIQKIKNRGFLFTYTLPAGWDLNLYLMMGREYNYLIDTGLGALSVEPIKEYIKDDPKPLIIINTHYHWDHIWGNHAFPGCTIISHSLCRERMKENWAYMLERNGELCSGEVEMKLPNLVFENELYFPDDHIKLFYTPGHTIDSISMIFIVFLSTNITFIPFSNNIKFLF